MSATRWIAGAGLNRRETVEIRVGAPRPRSTGWPSSACRSTSSDEGATLHLTREGGHSHRRIVHVADATGWAVQEALERRRAAHPNITLVPDMAASTWSPAGTRSDFSTSGGVQGSTRSTARPAGRDAPRPRDHPRHRRRGARLPYSTAPRGATGDGIAMAWRAGAASRTWNSCSSTRPASTTSRSRTS